MDVTLLAVHEDSTLCVNGTLALGVRLNAADEEVAESKQEEKETKEVLEIATQTNFFDVGAVFPENILAVIKVPLELVGWCLLVCVAPAVVALGSRGSRKLTVLTLILI